MVLRRIIPAPIKNKIRQIVRPEFVGDYSSWSAASGTTTGFDVPQIIDKVRSAILRVKHGEAAFERDSVCFYKETFQWPLLAALLHIAVKNGGKLHVADFGGSLGSSYLQHRKFLDGIRDLKWSIVEQPEFVKIGRQEFEDGRLKFFHTLDECAERGRIDAVLFSGSLQYLEDPFRFLERAAELSTCIIVDRTPFVDRDADRIAVQSFPASIYSGSSAHRFFSRGKFAQQMTDLGLVMLAEWPGLDHAANIKSQYEGRIYVARHASLMTIRQAVGDNLKGADATRWDAREARANYS